MPVAAELCDGDAGLVADRGAGLVFVGGGAGCDSTGASAIRAGLGGGVAVHLVERLKRGREAYVLLDSGS
jgi:hypothetical protein